MITADEPKLTADEIKNGLAQFYGSENFYRFNPFLRNAVCTDGVKWLADNAKCWWLLDLVASWQCEPKVRREEFQVWKLKVNGSKAVAECGDGNGNVVARQEIGHTDFPLDENTLWFENGTLMLPSER